MMNSNATHKIAVGVGLAAVFGLGVSVFVVRAGHESQMARNTMAATFDQNAADSTAPAQSAAAQIPAEQIAIPSNASPPAPPVAAPTAVDPTTSNVSKDIAGTAAGEQSGPVGSKASDRRRAARTRTGNSGDATGTAVAPAPDSKPSPAVGSGSSGVDSPVENKELASTPVPVPAPAPAPSDPMPSAPAGATADIQPALAQTGQAATTNGAAGAVSNVPVASDSQITAQVKSEIAVAAPTGSIAVSTTNGTVALVGSVPSQEAADQVRLVAQRVAGVKQVDVSALSIAKQ
jgi:hyperosmotically inducible protein